MSRGPGCIEGDAKGRIVDLVAKIDEILRRVPDYLARLRNADLPYGRYRWSVSYPRPWCMYATVNGLVTEFKLGMADAWTETQRQQAIAGLLDCQSETDGYFHCPVCKGDLGYNFRCSEKNVIAMTKKAVGAILQLGAKPKYPPPIDDSIVSQPVEDWLEQVFRENHAYAAGAMVGHCIGTRVQGLLARGYDPKQDAVIATVLKWLAENQDPETGLFRHKGDLVMGMNGLLKMRYGVFQLTGTPIPRPGKVVRTILGLQREDGRFGLSCGDFNGTTLTADLGRETPELHDAMLTAYERILPAFAAKQRPDGGFCWEPEDTDEPNLNATNVNTQGLADMRSFLTWLAERQS